MICSLEDGSSVPLPKTEWPQQVQPLLGSGDPVGGERPELVPADVAAEPVVARVCKGNRRTHDQRPGICGGREGRNVPADVAAEPLVARVCKGNRPENDQRQRICGGREGRKDKQFVPADVAAEPLVALGH